MKKIVYFFEFITIKILFLLFQSIGYRLSSNLGFFIGKTIGPIFRSKQLIDKAKKENLVLVTTEKDFFRLNKSQRKNIKFLKIKLEIKDKKNLEKIIISKL